MVIGCISLQNLLTVRTIEFSGPKVNPSIRGFDFVYGEYLPLVKDVELQHKIVQTNPQIENIQIQKNYPNTIVIRYQKASPMVVLRSGDLFYTLSEEGKVLSISTEYHGALPVISYYQQYYRGQISYGSHIGSQDVLLAVRTMRLLSGLGFKVKEVAIESFYMIRLVLSDSREIYVSTEKNIDKQEYQIRAVLKKFKVDGTSFRTLDVRFDKPVIQQ